MNKYPEWWDSTITLYNKYTDPLTNNVRYFRHVIDGCFWDNTQDINISDKAQISSNEVICRIRKDDRYKKRMEWEQLPNDEMGSYFTLGKDDILILGAVDDVIDENASKHRANDLIAKYKNTLDCIRVKRFSDNTGAGRVMPHYYLTGE